MKRTFAAMAASCGVAMLLQACGGGGGSGGGLASVPRSTTPAAPTSPALSVDDLAPGSYIVSRGDANAPIVGKYYAAPDGSRLLVFGDSDDRANQVYRREANADWVGVPASDQSVRVTLLQSNALPTASVGVAALAGRYRVQAAPGVMADFSVTADGVVAPGSSACKLSGALSAGALPNTLKLRLATSACGALPATATGVLAVDSDYAPARFRLVADDGAQLVDLWAYAE